MDERSHHFIKAFTYMYTLFVNVPSYSTYWYSIGGPDKAYVSYFSFSKLQHANAYFWLNNWI